MKHRNFIKNSIMALLPISLGLGVLLGVNKKSVEKVEGYSTSSLPTTIDLNDSTESQIRSYYSSLNNLNTNERQGNNLLKNLKTILKNDQKYYSYDSGDTIWKIYEITDRDWDKSPASSTTYGTYNSSTNKITNYEYGSGKNNPYIHALYINRDVTNQTKAWGNHNQNQWGINREHVWPKAEGFDESGSGGARGDPMHLMAGNGYVNNIHSNYYYGYVSASGATDCGSTYSNQSGNLRGSPVNANSGTVFEPQDCDKGDIARAIFYMVARYNYLGGSDSIDSNNPNLELTQDISKWASSGYTSTTSNTGKMGLLTDLLDWHHKDPVDSYEIHRNNLLYKNFTNNRNPFIDFPEWVDFIWGTATYNGKTKQSYSSSPTGHATPSSDNINGYNSGSSDPVSVTGVTLGKESTSIVVGSSEVLSYTLAPANATNQAVTWTSSNTSVATVSSSGRVEGVAEGDATITVTTTDGGFTDTCSVSVVASGGGSGEETVSDVINCIGFANYTTNQYSSVGTDKTAKANSSNATDVTYALQVFNGSSGAVRGNQDTPSANFSARNTTTYSDYYISRVQLDLLEGTSGTLDGSTAGRSLVYFGSSAYGNPTTAPTGAATTSNENASGVTSLSWSNSDTSASYFILYNLKSVSTPSKGQLTITWSLVSGESEATLTNISVKTAPTKLTYTEGEDFSPVGLVITATYSDSNHVDISYDDHEDEFEFDPLDDLETTDTSVTIHYGGLTCTQAITVNKNTTPTISLNVYTISGYTGESCSVTATFRNLTSDFYWGAAGTGSITDGTTSFTRDKRNGTSTYQFTLSAAGDKTIIAGGGGTDPQQCTIDIIQTTLSLNKNATSISKGGSETLTATTNIGSATWSSNNTSVATVNSSGLVSVPANATVGATATITATSNIDSSVSATCTVTVTDTVIFTIVTDASTLKDGTTFVLVGYLSSTYYVSNGLNQGHVLLTAKTSATTISNGVESGSTLVSTEAQVLTLEGSAGSFKIKYGDSYLKFTGSSNGNDIFDTEANASTFSASMSDDYILFTCTSSTGNGRVWRMNTSSKDMRNYATNSGVGDVYMFANIPPECELSSVTSSGQTTTFSQGSKWSYGGTLTAHYTGGKADATVTPTYYKYGVSGINPTTSGTTITTNTTLSQSIHNGKYIYVVYTENDITKYASYRITVNTNPTLTWTAPNINVYSGATLTSTDANGWGVTYNNGSGSITYPTYGQFSVKLGGSTIDLPYTWQPGDDGKTLCVSYSNLTTETTTVSIVQRLQEVMAADIGSWSYTFTSKVWSAKDEKTINSKIWSVSGTDDGSPYFGNDTNKGQQFGSSTHPFSDLSLQSSDFSGVIDSVTVYTSGANSINATVQVSVGGTAYGTAQSITNSNTGYTFDLGGKSGTISIDWVNSSPIAIYVRQIVVNYVSDTHNIANVSGHEDAQRAVVKFAKAFNTAMGTTNYCTTNMSTAWSSATSAWNTFLSEAAALGETEEAYAKNVIKYATAQYTDGTDSDYSYCLERAMATYEKCVKSHGQTAFMSAVRPVSANTNINPILVFGDKASSGIAVIIIVSVISVTSIGGYFFMKSKRKEEF